MSTSQKTQEMEEVSRHPTEESPEDPPVMQTHSSQSKPQSSAPEEANPSKLQWSGTAFINAQYFEFVGKLLPLDKVAFDYKLEHGQTRSIDDKHVDNIVCSLKLRPPREPVRVTVWNCEMDHKFYIMAGQHLTKAVMKIRDERAADGLPLEQWMEQVRADVLKFATPKAERKTMAGADNANTRVQRTTTVYECLRTLLYDGQEGDDLSKRILRAVEHSGLNIDSSKPYNTVRQWQPVASFVTHFGERALDAVRNFQSVEKQGLSVHTFRKLGMVSDPEFLDEVMSVMSAVKPSMGTFNQAMNKACRRQWYSWHVYHPELEVHK